MDSLARKRPIPPTVLTTESEILIPAATENVITSRNVDLA